MGTPGIDDIQPGSARAALLEFALEFTLVARIRTPTYTRGTQLA